MPVMRDIALLLVSVLVLAEFERGTSVMPGAVGRAGYLQWPVEARCVTGAAVLLSRA
ncbi:hypothetical protein Aglo03_26010 [Actinokineospora globicatena]|uniref:Uncharacterized protein n=1 Tax=Actinokineospora globicatena TaxID=103729 RepID=A0A9W6QLF6_9PSEU|nr:hypothetical protein Aglo03_26010 [Actinokineospora globicatena]